MPRKTGFAGSPGHWIGSGRPPLRTPAALRRTRGAAFWAVVPAGAELPLRRTRGAPQSIRIANSLPQSPAATAPSSEGAKGAGMCLPAGLARQNRQKLTKRGALCYDGDRRCQIRQAVSTSRKGGDAHGYIRRADPDRYFDREHLQSGLSDLQTKMTAPRQRKTVISFEITYSLG